MNYRASIANSILRSIVNSIFMNQYKSISNIYKFKFWKDENNFPKIEKTISEIEKNLISDEILQFLCKDQYETQSKENLIKFWQDIIEENIFSNSEFSFPYNSKRTKITEIELNKNEDFFQNILENISEIYIDISYYSIACISLIRCAQKLEIKINDISGEFNSKIKKENILLYTDERKFFYYIDKLQKIDNTTILFNGFVTNIKEVKKKKLNIINIIVNNKHGLIGIKNDTDYNFLKKFSKEEIIEINNDISLNYSIKIDKNDKNIFHIKPKKDISILYDNKLIKLAEIENLITSHEFINECKIKISNNDNQKNIIYHIKTKENVTDIFASKIDLWIRKNIPASLRPQIYKFKKIED